MQLTLDTLDGKYSVHSHAPGNDDAPGADGVIVNGDGETVIQNGLTFRKDANGFIWESSFTILNDHQVKMESTVDPSHGDSAAFVVDAKGNLTKSMVTYSTVLDASFENGALTLRGEITHSGGITALTMTKIS